MNHQVFEDWIFAEEPLTSQEENALQEHLSECESCRLLSSSWRAVEKQLQSAPTVGPAAGFTSRWQTRLEAERVRVQRRQSLAMLGFSVAGAVLLLGSLGILLWPMLQSPQVLIFTWAYRVLELYETLGSAREFFMVFLQTTFGFIPLIWWVFIIGIISELSVLWIVSLRLLTNPQRGRK